MKKIFRKEVINAFKSRNYQKKTILCDEDIKHLPDIVQKYLNYVGALGKENVYNFRVCFEGQIRSKSSDPWMKLISEQYNFVDNPTRIFFIKAKKMGIPAVGLHLYKNEKAIMIIKLAGLFTIVDAKGEEMDQGETVTVFNDMCFMAPATLIDKRIKWQEVSDLTVEAKFTTGKITISARLYFNELGELINFVSNDRFETIDGKTYNNYPWSTPVKEYKEVNGRRFPVSAEAIYHRPDGDFCYGIFNIKSIDYNCKELL